MKVSYSALLFIPLVGVLVFIQAPSLSAQTAPRSADTRSYIQKTSAQEETTDNDDLYAPPVIRQNGTTFVRQGKPVTVRQGAAPDDPSAVPLVNGKSPSSPRMDHTPVRTSRDYLVNSQADASDRDPAPSPARQSANESVAATRPARPVRLAKHAMQDDQPTPAAPAVPAGPSPHSGSRIHVDRNQGQIYIDNPTVAEGWPGHEGCSSCGHGHGSGGHCSDGSCSDGSCGDDCDGGCGGRHCGPCGGVIYRGGCGNWCSLCIPVPCLHPERFEFITGVQGFKDPRNGGRDSSFGFHEGFNWGAPLDCFCNGELGVQIGMEGVHSNFGGIANLPDQRDQFFVTAGMFRRVDWGLQGGVVFDYLEENWYDTSAKLRVSQVRGEASWVFPCEHEFGFMFMANTGGHTITGTNRVVALTSPEWETNDVYALFYRHRFDGCSGAVARAFAGTTNHRDGILGADARIPVSCCWAFEASYIYMIPSESSTTNTAANVNSAAFNETWNIGLSLVFTPQGRCCGRDPYSQPLLPVANNNWMLINLKGSNNTAN